MGGEALAICGERLLNHQLASEAADVDLNIEPLDRRARIVPGEACRDGAARDQFAEIVRLEPGDDGAAMEYGFLCYETKQPAMARRVLVRPSPSATNT